MASLIIASGPNAGDFYPLGRRTTVIGRDEAAPIQIINQFVSRKHMQIRFENAQQRYYALDMRSEHGLFINDRRITDETVLTDGDRIRVGETALLFTEKDFDDRESAMSHFKKVGERARVTRTE